MRELVFEGRWDSFFEYFKEFKGINRQYQEIVFMANEQRYLESLFALRKVLYENEK